MIKKLLLLGFILFSSVLLAQTDDVAESAFAKVQFPEGKTIAQVTAYPNPFNVKSAITFYSAVNQTVVFELKNVLGKSVFKQKYLATGGANEISINRDNLASGMYIYSIQTDNELISKRLVIK